MRIAIISDIHGNIVALDTVLADIDSERVDHVVCLGDVAEFGPQPREVLARLRGLGCPVVMGNTDERLIHPERAGSLQTNRSDTIEGWIISLLDDGDRAFIATFRPTVEIALDDGGTLLCCHGSPRSNTEIIRATTPDTELALMLGNTTATLIAGGHTHQQLLRRFRNTLFLNPGSVGLPFEERFPSGKVVNPPWAEYAIISSNNGRLSIDLRRVLVDVEALREAVRASDMPHARWWIKDWVTYQ